MGTEKTNCTQNSFDFVEEVLKQYEGRIEKSDKEICLICNNLLDHRRIECKVTVGCLNSEKYPWHVDGVEKTCSIIGGVGMPCENKEEVLEDLAYVLERYKFVHKGHEQLSLF